MKKLYIILLFILCVPNTIWAQLQLVQTQPVCDLGEIGWHTPKTVDFVLQNKAKHAVVLHEVKTDCGCTTTVWNQGQLLESGQKTTVQVTYDAQQLGRFEKKIRVSVRDGMDLKNTDLTIKGRVLANIIDYSRDYPCAIGGGIYISDNQLDCDNIQVGEFCSRQIKIVNGTKQNYTPSLMHLPSWIKVLCEPEVLRPGKEGKITFVVDAAQINTYGLTQTSVYLQRFMGDKVCKDNEIKVSLTLVPRIETDEKILAEAPCAVVDSVLELQTSGLKHAKRSRGYIDIFNIGSSPLEINRVQTYNIGMRVSVSSSVIMPGQSAKLEVKGWTESKEKQAKGRKRIILITNDPRHPVITVNIK